MYVREFRNISSMREYLGELAEQRKTQQKMQKSGAFVLEAIVNRCKMEFSGFIFNPATGECRIRLYVKEAN
jgi:hypothetical protein